MIWSSDSEGHHVKPLGLNFYTLTHNTRLHTNQSYYGNHYIDGIGLFALHAATTRAMRPTQLSVLRFC